MANLAEVVPRLLYTDSGRTLVVRPGENEDPEMLYQQICATFENHKIEQDREGNIIIMAPVGGEASDQNSEFTMQLRLWAKRDGRGRVFDSSAGFILPDGTKFSPDSAWVSYGKLGRLSVEERRQWLRLVPEFVVEIKSPSDRYPDLQQKMTVWMRNGVELAWLIHPGQREVLIYRQDRTLPELCLGTHLHGEGPLAGFTLDLNPIWQGLEF